MEMNSTSGTQHPQNHSLFFQEVKKLFANVDNNSNVDVYNIYELPLKIPRTSRNLVHVEIINDDTISTALRYKNEYGLNPLVLNMASDKSPGGGNLFLGTSQEEQLLCSTNLFQSLIPELYPFDKNWVIYTPQVKIVRDGQYNLMPQEKWSDISVISVAAPRCPGITKHPKKPDNFRYVSHQRNMEAKIEAIFKVASDHDHDSIILGDLGCGSNKNPVDKIIDIFRRCLRLNKHRFIRIAFAIYQPIQQSSKDLNLFEKFHKELSETSSYFEI